MNTKLLERVKRRILKQPEHFNISYFKDKAGPASHRCGTTLCIAGWAVALHQKKSPNVVPDRSNEDWEFMGCKVLDITRGQAWRLFYRVAYPDQFRDRMYDTSRNPSENAKVAAERIDAFISSGGTV